MYKRLFKKIKNLIFKTTCSIWFEKTLKEIPDPVSPDIDISLKFFMEDISILSDWMRLHHSTFPWLYFRKEIESAKANNHVYASISHQDNIIGYIKIGLNNVYIHDFDKVVHFPSNVALIYDIFVLPEYRGRHIASYAVTEAIQFLKQRGVEYVWCHIEGWNHASIKTFQKIGFKKKASIRFSRLLGFPFFLRNGYKPLKSLEAFWETYYEISQDKSLKVKDRVHGFQRN